MDFSQTLEQIDSFLDQEKWPDAESLIRQSIAHFGQSELLLYRLIKILVANKDNKNALRILNQYESQDSDLDILRCQILFRLQKVDEGRKLLKRLTSNSFDQNAMELEELARDLYLNHYFEECILIFEHLLQSEPDSPDSLYHLHVGLALCSWILESGDELKHARLALETRPDDPLALSLVGNALIEKGEKEKGLKILEQVGLEQLLKLQCEEGAKRLFRWYRKNCQDSQRLRDLSAQMLYWEKSKSLSEDQFSWAQDVCHKLEHSKLCVNCPETKRLVGFAYDPQISQHPLVNFSAQEREYDSALEEISYLGTTRYTNSKIVSVWFDRISEKVVNESDAHFWKIFKDELPVDTYL